MRLYWLLCICILCMEVHAQIVLLLPGENNAGIQVLQELQQLKSPDQPVSVPEQFPSENDKLKIEIQIDSTIYFQGKAINLLIKARNMSEEILSINISRFDMIRLDDNIYIQPVNAARLGEIMILKPQEENYTSIYLLPFYSSLLTDWQDTTLYQHHFMSPGRYRFKVDMDYRDGHSRIAESNTIEFEIAPLPDTLWKYLKIVRAAGSTKADEAVLLAEKYNGAFFEYDILSAFVTARNQDKEETIDQRQQRWRFIVKYLQKYPNSGYASSLSNRIIEIKEHYPELFEANKDWLLDQNTWIGLILTNKLNRKEK